MNKGNIEEHKKVVLKTGFCLYGILVDKTEAGIWLKTKSETSFINYDIIKEIRDDERAWF